MKQQNCVICGATSVDFGMHGYPYSQCRQCGHIFSRAKKRSIAVAVRKFETERRLKQGEVIQNTMLPSYINRIETEKRRQISMFKPFLRQNDTILDANASDGWFVNEINSLGYSIEGISQEDTFAAYWPTSVYQSRLEEIKIGPTYDTILFIKYLEFAFCPYSEILNAYMRLRQNGRVLAIIPFGNDPKKNYLSRAHEFSEKSLCIFAKNSDWNSNVAIQDNEAIIELHRRVLP